MDHNIQVDKQILSKNAVLRAVKVGTANISQKHTFADCNISLVSSETDSNNLQAKRDETDWHYLSEIQLVAYS